MKANREEPSNSKENEEEIYHSYFDCEKKYLEILYFQYLRNLKVHKFNKMNLIYFLDISEYLSTKIFSIVDKNKKDCLSLEEFIGGISVIFSKYFPENGKQLTNYIFAMMCDNSNMINYERITEFLNNLLFEVSIKSKLYNFEFFLNLVKKIRDFVAKIFLINSANVKVANFTRKDFIKIIEKSPEFINLIILLMHLLSPINEKLVLKLSQIKIRVSLNDDFEEEYEISSEFNEDTPRINVIPISFLGANTTKVNSFDKSYNENTIEKIIISKKNDKNKTNKHCQDNTPNSNSLNIYALNSVNLINASKSSQKDCSTDTSDISINKHSTSLQNQKANYDFNSRSPDVNNEHNHSSKNITTHNPNQKISNICNNNNNYNYNNNIIKNNFEKLSLPNMNGNSIKEADGFDIKNSHSFNGMSGSRKSNLSLVDNLEPNGNKNNYSDLRIKLEKENKSNVVDLIMDQMKDLNQVQNCDINLNVKLQMKNDIAGKSVKISDLTCKIQKNKEYNLGSENNNIIPIKNYKIIKGLEKEESLYSDIMILYKEIKSHSNRSKVMDSDLIKKNFKILYSKNFTYDNNRYLSNLEEFTPVILKIIEHDLLLIQQNLKTLENESVHFLSLKNFYFDINISKEENEYYYKHDSQEIKYFVLKIYNFKQIYYFLFESYTEMESFLTTLNRQIAFFSHVNFHNFRLILKTINLIESRKKVSCIHEINDLNSQKVYKLQTFKKQHMTEELFIFFKKVLDLIKMNKLMKVNLFPISSIYENSDFMIVEYIDNEFKINYDKKENNFTISLKKIELSAFIKQEVIKFKKIIKALNNKTFVSSVYELIDLQGLVGIKK